jgi:hypothetical protein
MDNVQNCDSYINIPSPQTYKTSQLRENLELPTSEGKWVLHISEFGNTIVETYILVTMKENE